MPLYDGIGHHDSRNKWAVALIASEKRRLELHTDPGRSFHNNRKGTDYTRRTRLIQKAIVCTQAAW